MSMRRSARVLLAKPGLDGHDRGVKVVAMALRDAGFDVIYLGLRQSVGGILAAAEEEDVDAIGLSILSGVHLEVACQVVEALEQKGRADLPIFLGGTIPQEDASALREMGIADVFPVGTEIDEVVRRIASFLSAKGSPQ